MRDSKCTPHPGDKFRCRLGSEIEVTGVVISVTKKQTETRCVYINRFIRNRIERSVVSEATLKHLIRNAQIVAEGNDDDPWMNAQRRAAKDVLNQRNFVW